MPALFSGVQKPKKKPVKPAGAPTTLSTAQQLKNLEANTAGDSGVGGGAWPTVYQTRTSDAQAQVNPFVAASAAPGGYGAASEAGGATGGGAGSAATGGAPTGDQVSGSGYGARTGLGQYYRPDMLPSAWDDPESLIDAYFRINELAKGSGDYGTLLQQAPDLGILYMALTGQDALQGNAHFVDWANNYFQNQRTPGGNAISPGQVFQALLNPGQGAPLNMYLNNPSLTPEDQVNNMLSAARYGLDTTLPGPILNAVLAQMDQEGREFKSWRAGHTGANSFSDYLTTRNKSLPIPGAY